MNLIGYAAQKNGKDLIPDLHYDQASENHRIYKHFLFIINDKTE
jgi:hypothetical protein